MEERGNGSEKEEKIGRKTKKDGNDDCNHDNKKAFKGIRNNDYIM